MEDMKFRLPVFWLAFFCAMILTPILELYIPSFIEDIIAGESAKEPVIAGLIPLLAVISLIPPVIAVLSISLKDSINCWINIIATGTVFAGLGILGVIEYLTKQQAAYYAGLILVGIVEFVIGASIVWTAWKKN
jgi:hypothetical protein